MTALSGQQWRTLCQHKEMYDSIHSLTAAVAALSAEQQQLKAALKEPQPPQRRGWRRQSGPSSGRCFNCSQRGHFACECPWDAHCSVCRGWGHSQSQCPSRRSVPFHHGSYNPVGHKELGQTDFQSLNSGVSANSNSLNFQGVPQ